MFEDPSSDLVIRKNEIEKYCKKYNCSNEKELDKYLWFECGVRLVIKD